MVAGDDDIGFSNTTSLIIAASKKLPLQIVASGVLAGTGDKDAWDGLMVGKGSPIKTAKDLEGKTIAVNNLNNSARSPSTPRWPRRAPTTRRSSTPRSRSPR